MSADPLATVAGRADGFAARAQVRARAALAARLATALPEAVLTIDGDGVTVRAPALAVRRLGSRDAAADPRLLGLLGELR